MTVTVLLIIATLLPLLSFGVLVFVGRRMGQPLAGFVGTFFSALSFIASLAAMIVWLSMDTAGGRAQGFGGQPIIIRHDWLPSGQNSFLQIGLHIDSLTIVMFSMITLVAAVVHVYSLGYMRDDQRFARYYTYLGLFCFSMLGLVIGGTLLHIFIFWELVGVCSYLLIGFWYEKKAAGNAAIKAFILNRIGDVGLIIGMGILFLNLGNLSLTELWGNLNHAGRAQSGDVLLLDGANQAGTLIAVDAMKPGANNMSAGLLTVIGIGLFVGAMGKSAQFPLHVWLADAMEGPTPISALIHAATMVAAGVYLVARVFPILTPDAKLFIAVIGCITLTIGALIAMVQTDIKKILAYSTISQLGYMMLAMGIGSWVGGMFHLITHAFFKALLFLGAGSVIHAVHHQQDITKLGGLIRKLPYTAITFGVGVLAIAGAGITINGNMIGLAGFYSKDLILGHAGAYAELSHRMGAHWASALFFWLPTVVAYLTAFYMMRCWMLTFWGKPRTPALLTQARESPVMYIPLVLLAVLSAIGGRFLGAQQLIENAARETRNYFDPRLRPEAASLARFEGFDTAWQIEAAYRGEEFADAGKPDSLHAQVYHAGHLKLKHAAPAFAVGIGLAIMLYWNGLKIAAAFLRFAPLRWLRNWLYHRMFVDELYMGLVVAVTMALSVIVAVIDKYVFDGAVKLMTWLTRKAADVSGWHDRAIVDGAVDGVAQLAQEIGVMVRAPQQGRIRLYVLVLMAGVAIGLAGAIVVVLSKV